MLATHCPLCNSALLQKDIKVQCPSCIMPVMTEEQYDARTAGSVSPMSENQASESYRSDNDHVGATNTVVKEKEIYDENNKSRNISCGKLGKQLMKPNNPRNRTHLTLNLCASPHDPRG